MRRFVLTVAAIGVVCAAGVSYTQENKGDTPKPNPAMKELEVFVGDWTYEGEQPDTTAAGLPFGPAGKFTGTETVRFILDGFFQECKWEDHEGSSVVMSGICMRGYDAKAKHYTSDDYDSDGSRWRGTGTLEGRVWTYNGTVTTATGQKVITKGVTKYSSDWSSYASTVEASADDGKTWSLCYTLKAKKISK